MSKKKLLLVTIAIGIGIFIIGAMLHVREIIQVGDRWTDVQIYSEDPDARDWEFYTVISDQVHGKTFRLAYVKIESDSSDPSQARIGLASPTLTPENRTRMHNAIGFATLCVALAVGLSLILGTLLGRFSRR